MSKRCSSRGDERRAGGVYLIVIFSRQVPLPPVLLRHGCSYVYVCERLICNALLFSLPLFLGIFIIFPLC